MTDDVGSLRDRVLGIAAPISKCVKQDLRVCGEGGQAQSYQET